MDRVARPINTVHGKAVRPPGGTAIRAPACPAIGTVSLRYDRAVVFAEAQGVLAARQDRVDTDLQEVPTPGYGVLNLRVGGQKQNFRVTLALDNVFDRLYVEYNSFQRDPYRTGVRVREPGRNLYASVSYRF